MTQYGRIRTGTVSLGGNGQFTRLSALLEIGEQPWNASLTEDLDLTISLLDPWLALHHDTARVGRSTGRRARAGAVRSSAPAGTRAT